MKKSGWFTKIVPALFAAALLASCDTGGGGGGSGGGTASSNKSSITVKIGSQGSSADILGDFGSTESDGFYYGVSYSGAGKSDGPKYGGKDDTITFDDVPYGSYTFSLDIYTDSTRKITLDTKTTPVSVSGSYTEVKFNLLYSEYENYYIVSDATSLWAALRGQKINGGGSIEKSKMVAGDETTYAKIYVTEDISINDNLMGGELFFDDSYYAVLNLGGNTLTFENFTVGDNVNAVFKDGSIVAHSIILNGNSSLSFDKIALSRAEDPDMALIGVVEGTMSFSNGSTITSEQYIAGVMGGTLTFDGTAITCSRATLPTITTTNDLPNCSAISQIDGNVVMGGGSSITCKNLISVYVGGGSFTMDASTAENTFDEESSIPCICVTGGIFDMTSDSSVTGYSYGIMQQGGTVVVNNSTVIGKNNQGGGTFVLVGGTVNTLVEDGTAVHMTTTSANCVTALVQSYTLDGKTYKTTNGNSVTSLNCSCSNNDAYILFGGDSAIENFSFNFQSGANGGIYFGQVAEPTRSRCVSFTKQTGSNPRVLATTPTAVFAAGFSVIDNGPSNVNNLFVELTGSSFEEDSESGYYALREW